MATHPHSSPFSGLAENLLRHASADADKAAVVMAKDASWITYGELVDDTERLANGLREAGVERGMRVVLMVRPGLDFLPLLYALFRLGAVPVLIDPGMGLNNLLHCVRQSKAQAFIGVPLAHAIRMFRRGAFRGISIHVTIGPRWFWGGTTVAALRNGNHGATEFPEISADDPAAIIFTTGSTGPPKGVEYTHGMFNAQCRLLQDAFGLRADDVDMPGFALFAIFTVAMGMTVVVPDMDPTRPANADPVRILETLERYDVTFSFGSPALWDTVSRYAAEYGLTINSVRALVMAGAPIPVELHERLLHGILPDNAEIHTPYGATEALPVTHFTGTRVLEDTAAMTRDGNGTCVGTPLPGIDVRIIDVTDDVISSWSDAVTLPQGETGEIVVRGPIVSRRYFQLPDRTAEHKIYETDDRERGPFWHRMGDLGYIDEHGRVWFCGRKSHRVETAHGRMLTVCCEAIFNRHPHVSRSALVGIGDDAARRTPVIIIEPEGGRIPVREARQKFTDELMELAREHSVTKHIDRVLFHPGFPVDIRHNAKIFREKLAVWAAAQEG